MELYYCMCLSLNMCNICIRTYIKACVKGTCLGFKQSNENMNLYVKQNELYSFNKCTHNRDCLTSFDIVVDVISNSMCKHI